MKKRLQRLLDAIVIADDRQDDVEAKRIFNRLVSLVSLCLDYPEPSVS